MGPLGSILEPLEAVSWEYVATVQFQNKKNGIDLGSALKSKMLPKRAQNGAQNAPKSNAKIIQQKRRALKTLLDSSWANLGSVCGRSWGQTSLKISSFQTVACTSAFLNDVKFESAC